MQKPLKPRLRSRLKLTQVDCPANFADASFDYPKKSFVQVAEMLLGKNPFPNSPNGRYFKRVCKEVFDRERRDG